jgi:hypothetical protein
MSDISEKPASDLNTKRVKQTAMRVFATYMTQGAVALSLIALSLLGFSMLLTVQGTENKPAPHQYLAEIVKMAPYTPTIKLPANLTTMTLGEANSIIEELRPAYYEAKRNEAIAALESLTAKRGAK